MNIVCDTGYLDEALTSPEELKKTIDGCVECLKEHTDSFNAIAFRGMSGALVAPAVSVALQKHLVMVRKLKEDAHSSRPIEGAVAGPIRYIIIDDFIATGETVMTIQRTIWHHNPNAECVGMCLYRFGASWHSTSWRADDKSIWFRRPTPKAPEPLQFTPATENEAKDFLADVLAEAIKPKRKLLAAP